MTQKRWDRDEIASIRTYACAGYSGAQIAREFGVSRNTIIGVCYRNGIKLGSNHPDPKYQRQIANAQNAAKAAKKRREARLRLSAPLAIYKPAPPPAPPEGISLADLTNTTCRWPLHTDLPARFCGAHAPGHGPYCAAHTAKAISPVRGDMA